MMKPARIAIGIVGAALMVFLINSYAQQTRFAPSTPQTPIRIQIGNCVTVYKEGIPITTCGSNINYPALTIDEEQARIKRLNRRLNAALTATFIDGYDRKTIAASIFYLADLFHVWNPAVSRQEEMVVLYRRARDLGVTTGLVLPALGLLDASYAAGAPQFAALVSPIISRLRPDVGDIIASELDLPTRFPGLIFNRRGGDSLYGLASIATSILYGGGGLPGSRIALGASATGKLEEEMRLPVPKGDIGFGVDNVLAGHEDATTGGTARSRPGPDPAQVDAPSESRYGHSRGPITGNSGSGQYSCVRCVAGAIKSSLSWGIGTSRVITTGAAMMGVVGTAAETAAVAGTGAGAVVGLVVVGVTMNECWEPCSGGQTQPPATETPHTPQPTDQTPPQPNPPSEQPTQPNPPPEQTNPPTPEPETPDDQDKPKPKDPDTDDRYINQYYDGGLPDNRPVSRDPYIHVIDGEFGGTPSVPLRDKSPYVYPSLYGEPGRTGEKPPELIRPGDPIRP